MTPPAISTRAWTALTPHATPIRHTGTPATSKPTAPFGDTQLSTDAWERVFARVLPGNTGYLVHRAWYALDEIPDGYHHRDGPLDAVALSTWLWWLRCTDYRDPDGTEIHHQAYVDSQILGPHLGPDDVKPYEHMPRAHADAYPEGAIVWDGHPRNAIATQPQLETIVTTETHRLLGHLWIGAYRTANPHDDGVQRGGVGVRQSLDSHAIAWHSATVTEPHASHVHPDRGDALRYVVARHHSRHPLNAMATEPDEETTP